MRAQNLHGLPPKPECTNWQKRSPVKTVKYNGSTSDQGSFGAINH